MSILCKAKVNWHEIQEQYFEKLVIPKIGLIPVLRILVCLGHIHDIMPSCKDTSHEDLVWQEVEVEQKCFGLYYI